MGFGDFVRDYNFGQEAQKLGLKVDLKKDRVAVGRQSGRLSGARAEVTAGASRGTLTRSVLQAGWQKKGSVFLTIVTGDGIELVSDVKDERKAREFVAKFNTRSGAHME